MKLGGVVGRLDLLLRCSSRSETCTGHSCSVVGQNWVASWDHSSFTSHHASSEVRHSHSSLESRLQAGCSVVCGSTKESLQRPAIVLAQPASSKMIPQQTRKGKDEITASCGWPGSCLQREFDSLLVVAGWKRLVRKRRYLPKRCPVALVFASHQNLRASKLKWRSLLRAEKDV